MLIAGVWLFYNLNDTIVVFKFYVQKLQYIIFNTFNFKK